MNGFPIELAERRKSASLLTRLAGRDVSVYWTMRTTMRTVEIVPTEILPRRLPTMPLCERLIPQIGAVHSDEPSFISSVRL